VARGKRRGFSPAAAARHSQYARVRPLLPQPFSPDLFDFILPIHTDSCSPFFSDFSVFSLPLFVTEVTFVKIIEFSRLKSTLIQKVVFIQLKSNLRRKVHFSWEARKMRRPYRQWGGNLGSE